MALEAGMAVTLSVITMQSCTLLLLLFMGNFMVVISQNTTISKQPQCQISSSFQSPYVTLLMEEKSQIAGCISQSMTNKSQEVHFISLGSSGFRAQTNSDFLPTVALHIEPRRLQSTHAGPLIIVLHTLSPVMWHLDLERISSSRISVVLTPRSQIMQLPPVKSKIVRKNQQNEKRLLAWVKQQYKAITSISRIQRANDITLHVGIDDQAPYVCDPQENVTPPNVKAFYVQPQPAEGCIGGGASERALRDVHVIELISPGSSSNVMVHLQPHGQRKITISDKPVVRKDLLLVLSCHKPVTWNVRSWGIKGHLHIVAQHPLIRESLPHYQSLHVEAGILPNTTRALLNAAIRSFGSVSTFTKAKVANKVKIFVEGNDVSLDDDESDKEPLHLGSFHFSDNVQSDGEAKTPNVSSVFRLTGRNPSSHSSNVTLPSQVSILPGHLQSSINGISLNRARIPVLESSDMLNLEDSSQIGNKRLLRDTEVQCEANELQATVSQDTVSWLAHRISGSNNSEVYLTFSDHSCKAIMNGTHHILQSSLEECGTTKTTEDNLVYHNQVLFWIKGGVSGTTEETTSTLPETMFDDEDLTDDMGSGSEPPRTIRFQNNMDGKDRLLLPLSFRCVYEKQDGNVETNQRSGVAHPHVYRMDVYAKNLIHPVSADAFPLQVHVHDHILVETRIDAGPHLGVIIDSCWLSDLPYSALQSAKRTQLIRDSCPTDLSVKLRNENQDFHSQRIQRFSFQLGDDFMGTLTYLHCRLAACSNAPSPRPDMKKCVNPEHYCEKQSLRPFLEKSPDKHFSLEIRGPLKVLPKVRSDKPIKQLGNFPKSVGLPIGPGLGKSQKDPESAVQHVIVIGLSTNTVVGIAFASFVIGAGLMAILWYIHLRTDPLRNERGHHPHIAHPSHHHPLHSGYDLSGHSGSSTPSSQAPMTGHACTSPGQT